MAKKVFHSEREAETSWRRAISFTRDVRGDEDRANEIEDMGLDQWLEETGRRIKNTTTLRRRTNTMPRKPSGPTREELLDTVATLEAENTELRNEADDLAEKLDAILEIASPDPDDEELEEIEDDEDEPDEE